ncbi:MAG TPA: hypothetical protein VI434_09680 [Candidatus Dormibacteraeota bacterium]
MESRRVATPAIACAVAVMLASCAAPAQGTSTARTGCVSQSQATQIWTSIDDRLNAIELEPHHSGLPAVTTGNAFTTITKYLQQQLVAHGFTEREVDHLDELTVVQAGCNNGRLILNVTMTLVQDDYLNAAGKVDHQDASVGRQLNILQEYVRSGSGWKETDFSDLTPPASSPTPQIL